MNSYYKQSVIVFGWVIPLLLMLAVILGMFYWSSDIDAKYKKKKSAYGRAQKAQQKMMELQGRVGQTGPLLASWENMLSTETRGTFLEHWKTAESKFSGRELTRSPHSWVNYSDGLGRGLKQPASQVNMSFSATFRAMQLALMEVESKLPQMQLDSLTMVPEEGNSNTLNFKTTFTVWTQK